MAKNSSSGKNSPKQPQSGGSSPSKSQRSGFRISCTQVLLAGLAVFVALMVAIHLDEDYVFDEKMMQEIAKKAIAKNSTDPQVIVDEVVRLLRKEYGDSILDNPEWIFNNAGGAMGSMLVLHCSLTEYLIIFGTPLGTEGHTGRFLADDYFTILYGEQWAFSAGELEKEVYRAGEQHHLPLGHAKQYMMPSACWALEYARGNVMLMMPFGFWDGLFSTLDFVSMYKTFVVSAGGAIRSLMQGKI